MIGWFAVAAASPLVLFAASVVLGGVWPLLALVYMTALALMLDLMIAKSMADAPDEAEFPAADALLILLGLGHLMLLPLVVWAVAGPSGLTSGQRVVLFVAAGLWMGQVAHPAAHELIHRGNRLLFRLGVAVYVSMLIGHHASAHRLVHHRHVASPDDPNTARRGEGFWRYLPRAWIGSFRAGFAAETVRYGMGWRHPYTVYVAGAVAGLACGYLLAGWAGLAVWLALSAHAQMQLFLSDYVQHYGLTRATLQDGKLEPVGPRHSWNAAHWFSGRMMLNAPRHSDHHSNPARPYPALRLPEVDAAPRLPWPLPLACTFALIPPLWRRAIRPHLAPWRKPLAQP
ncbi:MAG: alkane 1-monooxygenase [Paracoccaceae bacterium]